MQQFRDLVVYEATSSYARSKTTEASYQLILQRHKYMSLQLMSSAIVNRILCFLCLLLMILGGFVNANVNPIMQGWLFLGAVEATLLLICFHWFYRGRSLELNIAALEQVMMYEAGGGWEDRYIKARYKVGHRDLPYVYLLKEACLWICASFVVILLIVLQMSTLAQ